MNDADITELMERSDADGGRELARVHHAEMVDKAWFGRTRVRVSEHLDRTHGGYRVTEDGPGRGHVYWAPTLEAGRGYVDEWNKLVSPDR